MYYLARGCNINGGKLNLTVAPSNIRNADGSWYWYKITYKKDAPLKEALRSFFVDVLCGNIHFHKSSRLKAAKIAREMGALYRQYTPNITFDEDFTLGFDYTNQSYEILAESYGVPLMLGENPDDVVVKLQRVNNEAKEKYQEKLDRFAADHIVLMQYASRITKYPEYCVFMGNYLDPHFGNTPLVGLLANYDSHGKYNNRDNSLIPIPAGREPEEVAYEALTRALSEKK